MSWIKGEPKKEGEYLTIREYDILGKITFSKPKTCMFNFCRYRTTNEIVVTEEGIKTCWTYYNKGEIVDYYMDLPLNPIKN